MTTSTTIPTGRPIPAALVLDQHAPEPSAIRGVAHATWASGADGLSGLSVWRQRLSPGAATPPHRHDCDEVVLCESGWGELHTASDTQRFREGQMLALPAGRDHRIVNIGTQPLEIVGIFSATPVRTRLPDGTPLELPWRS